ncbi:phage tail tape measure protein [Rhizobium ruizarguesonis]|uniref:phage tail tape measure protein n=1 Tax=Rhizobium leguminosarum TaxID=384 RepID=UPI00102FC2F7|nr:phage tail tape measure protein [Rhizobium leguminosarum]TBE54474.1 phage tail tape measure protein [Rhizobium leguminosarum]WSH59830.1 phage tail tape measure protein [Rhizobium ruizarguesonis]
MARKTIKQRITLDGGKEIEEQLKRLGQAGEKAFGQIKGAASKVDVNFGKSLNIFARDLATTGKQLAYVFAGLNTAAIGAVTAIAAIAKSGAEAADASGKAAQSAGLQIDAYGRLAFAAEQNDVAAEAFGAAMSKLNKALGEAAGGSKEAKAKFTALGLSITDAKGKLRPTEQIVRDLAERFSKMPDGAKKSAAALSLFGKAGAALIPFLNEGKQGLINLGETAEHLGIVFTDSQKEIGDALGDTLGEVQKAVTGTKNQIGLLFAPAITASAAQFRDALLANRDAILAYAKSLVDTALPVIQDFISALTGNDEAVKNIWVLQWRDAVIEFGKSTNAVISGIVIPAFSLLKKSADLVAGSFKALTGFNVNGTMLLIAVAVGQLTGAFRLMVSTVKLAIASFNLLKANPLVAVVSVVAGGLALWATRTDAATAAMERHEEIVGKIEEAYRKAGLQVEKMAQDVRDRLLIETRNAFNQTTTALDAATADLKQWLASLPAGDALRPMIEAFVQGKKSVEELNAELGRFGAANPEFGPDIEDIQKRVTAVADLTATFRKQGNEVQLLQGTISDAEFQARNFTAEQKAMAAASGEATQKVAETKKQVEALGKTITVHSSDGGKPVQQTFDLVDGVAKAADASKQSLDGVSESAAKAGENVAKVKDDVSNLIIHVPDELKGQPTVADAMTQGLSDVPAAAKAAADGVIAEVSRVPQAVAGALSGGVQQGQGGAGGTGGTGGDGTQQQAQPTGGIADTLAKPFEEARDRIAAALIAVPTAVTTALQTVQTAVAEGGAALGDALVTPFEAMATKIAEILERMTSAVRAQFDEMLASVRSTVASLQSAVAQLESLAARAEAAAARAKAATSGGDGNGLATGGLVGRFAGGGRVSGPGTPTSDSIPARLSVGEFVIKARAVQKYGAELFALLNGGRLPVDFLDRLKFAAGGFVSSLTGGMSMPRLVPAFADGGPVATGGGRPINLTFDGQTFPMIAPEDVADRLAKHQGRQGLRKAGKKPSWR